jgi:cation transport protein ChaC
MILNQNTQVSPMYVFGYGSLMIDGWEQEFDGTSHTGAKLINYQRSFNKSSTVNWGTRENPCPTLGLEPSEGSICVGCVFEFSDSAESKVRDHLRKREGKSFSLERVNVQLPNGGTVRALTPVNDLTAKSYVGNLSTAKRQALVRDAAGTSGSCSEYVHRVHQTLRDMGVHDQVVEDFVAGLGVDEG